MISQAERADLPVLIDGQDANISDGRYVVHAPEPRNLIAKGPEVETEMWFHTPPLSQAVVDRIHTVQLEAESRDQGWSDEELGGNWTWFEVSILETPHDAQPRIKDGITLTWVSHSNPFLKGDNEWAEGTVFDRKHDMFRLLEDGNVLAVRLCARFAGWELKVRQGILILKIGSPVSRDPLEFGQIKKTVLSIQEVFQDVNSSIFPESMQISVPEPQMLFRAEKLLAADDRPLRVLSLDGGGVRGVAALMILDAVLKKATPGKKPCEVFDMIGGTSTGGLIAIMLGRLQMTVPECLQKYSDFMDRVFPGSRWAKSMLALTGSKWDAGALEDCIKELVKEKLKTDPDEVLLLDEETSKMCKIFVTATRRIGSNNRASMVFRSYENPLEKSELPSIKLWEAARATSAAPSYFKPLKVGDVEFVDGGLQANNPLGWVWNEVLGVYGPARATSCFLSIGTGTPLATGGHDVRNLPSFAGELASIATNTELTNILFRSLINAFAPRPMGKKYWRFNVGDGLPDWVEGKDGVWRWTLLGKREEADIGDLDNVKAIGKTKERAAEYIKLPEAGVMIGDCADAMKREHQK